MPDERSADKPEDDAALEQELAEFEAELFRAAEGIPKSVVEGRRDHGTEGPRIGGSEGVVPELPSEEEIEERLSRAIKEAEEYLGPTSSRFGGPMDKLPEHLELDPDKADILDPELRERIDRFNHTVDKIKAAKQEKERLRKRHAEREGEASRGLGLGIAIAYTIIGVPLLGALVGYFIDNAMGTKTWVGICVLIGAVLGVGMGLVLMNRGNKES
jgi:F0F1-type ATP synthase assembly protein I